MDFRKALYEIRKHGILMTVNHKDPAYDCGNRILHLVKELEKTERSAQMLTEDKERRERVYSRNNWSVIKRLTDNGYRYSVVRYGSCFFEHTFIELTDAIAFCDGN
ncbi:MAG: hypothetical protein MJ095_00100 [Oscillospiraceae bacterium]|nr:hypothetical protein [Oscillospiraceae bacterium]